MHSYAALPHMNSRRQFTLGCKSRTGWPHVVDSCEKKKENPTRDYVPEWKGRGGGDYALNSWIFAYTKYYLCYMNVYTLTRLFITRDSSGVLLSRVTRRIEFRFLVVYFCLKRLWTVSEGDFRFGSLTLSVLVPSPIKPRLGRGYIRKSPYGYSMGKKFELA